VPGIHGSGDTAENKKSNMLGRENRKNSKKGIEMSEMMNYNECLAYVMKHKLRTYYNECEMNECEMIHSAWNVTDERYYISAPTYEGAINTWKARYGESPCAPTP